MKEHDDLRKTVSKWLDEDKKLLVDVHNTQDIILIIERLSKEKRSITKYIVSESPLRKSAVYRKLRTLMEDDLITSVAGGEYFNEERNERVFDRRTKLHYLTKKGQKIAEYLKIASLPERPPLSAKPSAASVITTVARVFHSERIKELLKEIASQMPQFDTSEVYYPSSHIFPRRTYDGEALSFEDDVLFDDLKNHLLRFGELNESYSCFKKSCDEFRRLKEKILEEIRLDVSKNLELQFSPDGFDKDFFSSGMTEWIFEAGLYLGKRGFKGHFEEYFLDFISRIDRTSFRGEEALQYWVSGRDFIHVAREHDKDEIFRQEMDEKLRAYLEGLGDTPYFEGIAKAHALLEEAKRSREDFMVVLRKNLEVPIFDGDCEILRAALRVE